jgi:hypothetical protein
LQFASRRRLAPGCPLAASGTKSCLQRSLATARRLRCWDCLHRAAVRPVQDVSAYENSISFFLFLTSGLSGGLLEAGAHVTRTLNDRPTRPRAHPFGRHGPVRHTIFKPTSSDPKPRPAHQRLARHPKTSFIPSPGSACILFQTASPFGPAVSCPVHGRACPPPPDKGSWFLIRRRFSPSRTGRLCPPPFPPMHCLYGIHLGPLISHIFPIIKGPTLIRPESTPALRSHAAAPVPSSGFLFTWKPIMGIFEFRSHIRAGQEWHHAEKGDDPCRMLAVLQELSSDHIAAYVCSRLLRLDPRFATLTFSLHCLNRSSHRRQCGPRPRTRQATRPAPAPALRDSWHHIA